MKKVLKIVGIVLAIIILAMIAIPLLFKGKIKDAVLNVANKELNATVSIDDFGLNLFSNFPNATLSLDGTTVVGKAEFAKDTLLQAKSASITIDLSSLFGDNFSISRINLDNASVYAKVLEDGKANWDIVKTDSTQTETVEDETSGSFNLNLNKITVKDCNIIYEDLQGKMKAMLVGWNGTISGDFTASETTIKTSSTINEISFYDAGVPYLLKAKIIAEADVKADMDAMKFSFINSSLQLNELKASVDGSFAMVGEDGMDFDLKLNAPNIEFKEILSMVPAMYTEDFKGLKTAGTAKLDASVKGLMQGEIYPAFDVKIAVADAMFQYPSLPKSVDKINVDIAINNKQQGSLDNMVIDISKFNFSLGGNPFSGALNVTTPMSDANIRAHANGTIDLEMIKQVYPLETGTELNGKIEADIKIATRMSAIEKEQYESVEATGHLKLNEMKYKADEMPEVLINNAVMEFTPRYVNLSSLDVKIGKNDISANGRLENFIAYAMKDQTLKGQLNISSNYLNANDFISEETSGVEVAADSTATSEDIIIPKNINFVLNANLKQIVYGKMDITNMNGAMTIKDGILNLNNVSANALGGSAKISGAYNTSNPKNPKVNFAVELSNVSFAETFKSVESIQRFAPIFDKLTGNYSMSLNFDTSLGATMQQTLGALTGNGSIKTSNLKIEGVESLSALSAALKSDDLKSFSAKDINLPFSVKDGRLTTKPFSVNFGQGGLMKLEGSTGLDQTINYKGTVTLPKGLSNKYVSNVPVTIGGTFDSPKIGVDAKALAGSVAQELAGNLLGDKAGAIGSILSGGNGSNKDPETIRKEAQETSDKLVEAAKKQAKSLEDKAGSNKIVKAAAKGAGKKLVDAAKAEGKKITDKAEEQAKAIEAESASE